MDSTNSSSSTTSSTIPSVGLIVVVEAFKIPSSSLSESSSGLVSLKVLACLALPNALEISRTLMFHVIESLTPKALRSCENSVMTTIPSILLPFVLSLELRRTRLPKVLVEALSIGILHKLLELPGDVGLHLGIFIVRRLICVTALGLQSHAFAFTRLAYSC